MAKSVYLETTIPSYLAARLSRDLVLAGHQQVTWQWWETRRSTFRVYVSQVVLDEIARGDPEVVRRRLEILNGIPTLAVSPEVIALAEQLVGTGLLPPKATPDAYHLAVAAVNGVDFLLTWNCRHLANAQTIRPVTDFLRALGHQVPVVCTPDELIGG